MLRPATILCLILLAPSAGAAVDDDDRAAIRTVIERQLDAFRRDDAEAAFSFAAPGIRAKFGSPARFIAMVRTHYRAVYRPRHVLFRGLDTSRLMPVQDVLVVGPDGASFLARYPMQKQPGGGWLIAGCYLLPFEGEEI